MKKSTVRIFAIVLVVLMCLSLLPLAAAHAMEYPAEMPEIPDAAYDRIRKMWQAGAFYENSRQMRD